MKRTAWLLGVILALMAVPIRGEMQEEEAGILHPDSLDTGEYRAVVVQDPADKQAILGYFHLAQVTSMRMNERPYPGALPNLVDAINEYTDIQVDLAPVMSMGARDLHETPWVFLAPVETRPFMDRELKNLGRYLIEGGFLLVDAGPQIGGQIDIFVRQTLKDALKQSGRRVQFKRLRANHPIYHSYFDFDSPPPSIVDPVDGVGRDNPGYLVGVQVGRRLAAAISYQNLAATWENAGNIADVTRHLQFGINTVVFALTQEGGITPKLPMPERGGRGQ